MKYATKTNNKTALLAILAVFAMIAAGVAVAMAAGEAEAAPTGDMPKQTDTAVANYYEVVITDHAAAQAIAADDEIVYLDMSSETADVTLTLSGAYDATVYVKPATASGVKLVLAGVAAKAYTVAIAKSIADDTHTVTYYCNSVLTVTKAATASNDTITLAYSDATGPTITCKASADNSSAVAAATYGVTFNDVSEKSLAIYAQGATAPALTLSADSDVVSVMNGSATVTSWTSSDDGYSVVGFANVVSATAFTLTCADAAATKTVIGGGAAAATGAITISAGAVTTTDLVGNSATLVWNTFSTAAMSADLDDATLSAQGAATTAHVYGAVSGTIAADTGINFYAATGNYTVGTSAAMLSTVAATLVVTDEVISAWTAGDVTLTSGTFTTAMTNLGGALVVGTASELTSALTTVAAGQNITVRGTMTLSAAAIAVTDANINVYGTMISSNGGGSTFTMDATATHSSAFKANAGSTLTKISVEKAVAPAGTVTIDLSGATGTVYLKGTISSDATYSQTQAVVVEGDLEVTGGALITIEGSFDVLEGVEVTIVNGTILIDSDVADVEILGDVLIEEKGFLDIENTKAVKISSTVDNFGMFLCNTASASITDGAIFSNEDGAFFKADDLTVAAGATATLAGFTDVANITNKGTVILDGAELARIDLSAGALRLTPTTANPDTDKVVSKVTMAASGAIVNVKSFAFVNCFDATASTLTIDDSGISAGTKYDDGHKNVVVLSAENSANHKNLGLGLSGIAFESSTSTSREGAVKDHYLDRTLYMSGIATIVDVNAVAIETPAATITLNDSGANGADFQLADGVALTAGITLDVNDSMSISGIVVLTDAQIDADGGDLVISGLVSSNKITAGYGVKASATVSAVSLSITALTATTYYWTDLEGAIELIELAEIEENVTLTVSGEENVVAADVTIPENIRIAGAGIITISPSTVTVTVEDGATAVAGVTFDVKGTLAVENVKKFAPTVISDVTVEFGNSVEYTSINRALAEAEVGDVITVTKTDGIVIASNLTIPAGVTLVIPDDIAASVNVAKKVTITVNGILMCHGITGTFGTEVTTTTAVMKVNGIAMFAAPNEAAIGAIADTYVASGAYWFVSDAIGDYVYIGSLADAIDSGKAVKVYGKVNETESVKATKNINLVQFTDDEIAAALPTVLTVSALAIGPATADVALVAAEGTTINGQVTVANTIADAVVSVSNFNGTLTFDYDTKISTAKVSDYTGSLTVQSGELTLGQNVAVNDTKTLTILSGAELVVPTNLAINANATSVVVAGTLTAENGGSIAINSNKFVLTGMIYVDYDDETKAHGDLAITNMTFTAGSIVAAEGADIDILDNFYIGVMPGTTGAAPTVSGKVTLPANKYIIAYPGADVDEMIIGDADDYAVTVLMLDGEVLATVYADKNTTVQLSNVIAALPIQNIIGIDPADAAAAKANPARWGITDATLVGEVLAASADIAVAEVGVKMSWDTGMSLYVDNVRITSNAAEQNLLTVGTHTVMVKVNPGYKYADGTTPSITFNGKAITGLLVFEITADMAQPGAATPVLSATADIVVDEQPIPEQKEKDDTMMLVLLAVLVIMIAILVVVVILRMMRS